MKGNHKPKNIPGKVKRQLRTALLLLCAVVTFAVPAFGGGYSVLKEEPIRSSATAIEDVDLLLVGASAFGEARKVINASDNDAIDIFVNNTSTIIGTKWQNIGLLIGPRDALSGTTWNTYQAPNTLSDTEVIVYNNNRITDAYNKYKAFGFAVQNLGKRAIKSQNSAVSLNEGLDAMSTAAIRLGSFGTEFLNDYNPGPVLLALYDSSYLSTYHENKLVQFVASNQVLKNIVCLFGDKVGNTGLSFFVLVNAIIAIVGFALSMLLTLLGNRNIGDGVRKFLTRVIIGTVGIYLIANLMSTALKWVTGTIMNVGASETSSYVENNLNMYDWYLTGFSLPSGLTLEIDSSGNFVFTPDAIRQINYYTYNRLVGGATDENIKARMETYTQNINLGIASFVMPSRTNSGSAEQEGASSWSTDAYYAIMDNYAMNKEDLLEGKDEEGSPLAGKWSVTYASQYLYMSALSMTKTDTGWTVKQYITNQDYYGLNPISAFNLLRSDFSGSVITATYETQPKIPYVAFDAVTTFDASGSTHMNSITRFIASFTLILAAMKGLITIFTAGFGGMLSGGIKTALGSSNGLGQALGGVIALICGIIGISVIMSISLSLLDTVYGIAKDLIVGSEVVDAFLQPVSDSLSGLPFGIGDVLTGFCKSLVDTILTLILALTFPKLGNIPITVFAQFMADLPGRMAEKAQMIEGMLMSGRGSAGGGLPHGGHGGRGQYGRQAQQMAGQAFSQGTKQAGAVVAAGAAAAGSLVGAGLSLAGKGLNKKADKMEGKPENPGVSNWDEMSPDQQSKTADTAANTENWDQMDEDARQNALEAAGVYDDNAADGGSGGNAAEGGESEAPEGMNESEGGSPEETPGEPETATETAGSADVPEAGAESSMNGKEADAPPVSGDMGEKESISGGEEPGAGEESAEAETDGGEEPGPDSGQLGGENDGGNEAPDAESDKESLNVNEGDNIEGSTQQIDSNMEQQNNMQAQEVDESRTLDQEESTNLDNTSMDGTSTSNTTNMPDAPAGAENIGGQDMPGAAAGQGTDGHRTGAAGTGGSQTTQKSVNNTSNTGGNSHTSVNAKSQQNTKVNTGGDHSKTVNNQNGASGQRTQKPGTQRAQKPGLQRAQKPAGTNQSMNGSSTSKWGKEMSIKQQKQARALHAAGDALQMMGGNRTMGQGIKEALGYAKDAAVAYTIPEASTFMNSVRTKRIEQQQKRDRRERMNRNQ